MAPSPAVCVDLAKLKPEAVHMNKIMWSSLYSTWIWSPAYDYIHVHGWFCKFDANCYNPDQDDLSIP